MAGRDGFLFSPLYWLAFIGSAGLVVVGCWMVEVNGGGGWLMLANYVPFLGLMAATSLLAQWQRKARSMHAGPSEAADSR